MAAVILREEELLQMNMHAARIRMNAVCFKPFENAKTLSRFVRAVPDFPLWVAIKHLKVAGAPLSNQSVSNGLSPPQ
ncbi:hypothetical protein [Pseudovibrio ascidiaceicola]|uniref:hypothetical protein n=1 Tax=Pseudovibrio ascidiaceicola TaxID=285279 RepID=UPI00135AA796|nr:hypothetical protein [Pseudovibrio ascidiaceicola]